MRIYQEWVSSFSAYVCPMSYKSVASTLAALAFFSLGSSASAADLPSRKAPPAYIATTPIFSWTGFYVGADAGFSAIKDRTVYPNGFPADASATLKSNLFAFGAHAGYRMQFANNLVAGVEMSAESLGRKTAHALPNGFPAGNESGLRANYGGALRGSLGLALGRSLIYASGGMAYLSARSFTTQPYPVIQPDSEFKNNRLGWTLGAGYAYALSDSLSVKAEYRYANFGTKLNETVAIAASQRTRIDSQNVRIGLSYTFGASPSVVAKY